MDEGATKFGRRDDFFQVLLVADIGGERGNGPTIGFDAHAHIAYVIRIALGSIPGGDCNRLGHAVREPIEPCHWTKHRGTLVCLDNVEPGFTHKVPVNVDEEIHVASADREHYAAACVRRVLCRVR